MTKLINCLASVMIAVALAVLGTIASAALLVSPAQAAAPYQGIYVIMNPYNPVDLAHLDTAAQTPCTAGQPSTASPFCTASNGIFFRFPWCDFQLFHVTSPQGQPYPSCHYILNYSNGAGSKGVQTAETDAVSDCPGTYDTCSGFTQSQLAQALRYVPMINTQRAKAGLPPLQLSIGMYGGIGTPQAVFDTQGFIDLPANNNAALDPNTVECFRLPLPWRSQFLRSYLTALDELLAYIPTQLPAGANIAIVKLAAITGTDAELQMPGAAVPWTAPVDPGPATRGPLLHCNGKISGAQSWLNAYNARPITSQNLSQADENAYGTVVGHVWATLLNAGMTNVLLSIPTTDGDAFPYVVCGLSGSSTCQTDFVSGPWSTYYFESYTYDLFHGGLSYTAAASAYARVRRGPFSLSPAQLSINATDLSPLKPITASAAVPCVINNTAPGNNPVEVLNGVSQPVSGVGTVIGWQTLPNEAGYCTTGQYLAMLNDGINQGSLFLEVETDAAFANLSQCSPALTTALSRILASVPPTSCLF